MNRYIRLSRKVVASKYREAHPLFNEKEEEKEAEPEVEVAAVAAEAETKAPTPSRYIRDPETGGLRRVSNTETP